MTLEGDDNHEETPSEALTPGVEGMETPLQEDTDAVEQGESSSQSAAGDSSDSNDGSGLSWILPERSDKHDTDGRTGLLSTRTEVHALVIGVTVGAHVALTGDLQLINDIAGIGLAGDRARQAKKIPKKYQEQAKEELPYFLAGVAIGYSGARVDALAGLNLGV